VAVNWTVYKKAVYAALTEAIYNKGASTSRLQHTSRK